MAAPTPGTPASTAYNSQTTPKTADVAVTAGDVIVAVACAGDSNGTDPNLGISGGGLVWTLEQQVLVNSNTNVAVWTAIADTTTTVTVSFSITNDPPVLWGGTVQAFSGSDGVGASSKTNTTGAPSLGLTTTGDNSAIVAIVGDWAAIDGTTRTWLTVNGDTPTAGNGEELNYFRDAAIYSTYAARWGDAGTAGAKTVGL